jgi:hypothetical protein
MKIIQNNSYYSTTSLRITESKKLKVFSSNSRRHLTIKRTIPTRILKVKNRSPRLVPQLSSSGKRPFGSNRTAKPKEDSKEEDREVDIHSNDRVSSRDVILDHS